MAQRIIFGSYCQYAEQDDYLRLMPPDVFTISKTDLHRICERYNFLVPKSHNFDFIENKKYIITATNKYDSMTHVVKSMYAPE